MDLFFWRRRRSLAEHLAGKPKKIQIDRVDFVIRKINLLDHAQGLNVLVNFFATYTPKGLKAPPRPAPAQVAEETKQVQKFMRDFLYAGVVSPKLHIKPRKEGETLPPGEFHVDDLLADMELSSKVFGEIYRYSVGKKKTRK